MTLHRRRCRGGAWSVDRRRRWISSRREKEGRERVPGTRCKKSEKGEAYTTASSLRTHVDARDTLVRCHGSFLRSFVDPFVRLSVRPSVRSYIRSYIRTRWLVGSFVRFFVMTVDETMTYFSGFHSRRAPRLFHSRFLASSPSVFLGRGRARMHARTHAHSRVASGAVSSFPTPLLLPSTASFLPFPPTLTAHRSSPLSLSLSLSFSSSISLNRSTTTATRLPPLLLSFVSPARRCRARDLLDHLERAKGDSCVALEMSLVIPLQEEEKEEEEEESGKRKKKMSLVDWESSDRRTNSRWTRAIDERAKQATENERMGERERERESEAGGINRHGWREGSTSASRDPVI